jgi:hypothetical protein
MFCVPGSAVIGSIAMVGEEYPLNQNWWEQTPGGVPVKSSNSSKPSGYSYTEPLTLEWEGREWVGLGIGLVTIVATTILTLLSSHFRRRRQINQHLWGGLTEQGVGDLLEVRWRYHHHNQQLVLQVFENTQIGYNDDNSLLQGSAVVPHHRLQEGVIPHHHR